MLERNLTDREVKPPHFSFTLKTVKGKKKVQSVSLSGREVLGALADLDELTLTRREIKPLYEGVWTNEIKADATSDAVVVLKELGYGRIFNKNKHGEVAEDGKFALLLDLSELLRKSLRHCLRLLRNATSFDVDDFTATAETYFQTSMLLFGERGISPYKAKLMLFPQLIKTGFVKLMLFMSFKYKLVYMHHVGLFETFKIT